MKKQKVIVIAGPTASRKNSTINKPSKKNQRRNNFCRLNANLQRNEHRKCKANKGRNARNTALYDRYSQSKPKI